MRDDADPAVGSGATKRPVRHARLIAAVLLGGVACAAVALCAALWSVSSARGSAWLLSRLPGIQVDGASGALLGDFQARRVFVSFAGQNSITITSLQWTGLRLAPAQGRLWFGLHADTVSADRVDLSFKAAANAAPMAVPDTLRWPIETQVNTLRIAEIHLDSLGDEPLRGFQASVHLSALDGAEHRVDELALIWTRMYVRGSVRVATAQPLNLTAALGLAQAESPTVGAWSAALAVSGPLETLAAELHLRANPSPRHAAQALDVNAVLRPFQAWPLAELQASTAGLDLSAFSLSAPETALSGRATVRPATAGPSAQLTVQIFNERAGRWSDAGLPVRGLSLEGTASLGTSRAVRLTRFDADLGTRLASAGRVTGQAEWSNDRWRVDASLQSLQPAALDARGPDMQLSGTCNLSGATAAPMRVDVHADLQGLGGWPDRRFRASKAVRLLVDASVSPQRLEVRALKAMSAGAQARLSGVLTTPADGSPMSLKAQGSLVDFDPAVWWPGDDASPLRQANNRLNAQASADVSLPRPADPHAVIGWLAGVRGQADVTIDKSALADVALTGHAALRSSVAMPASVSVALNAGGNELNALAKVDVAGTGAGDAWEANLRAPSLDRIQPILALVPGWSRDTKVSGQANADLHASGRWPSMTTQGHLDANELRFAGVRLAQLQATWSLGTALDAPLTAQISVSKLNALSDSGTQAGIDTLGVQLQGTATDHTLAVRAESAGTAAPWIQSLSRRLSTAPPPADNSSAPAVGSAPTDHLSVANLRVHGGLTGSPSGETRGWNGAIDALDIGGDTATWVRANGLALRATWTGPQVGIDIQPGRAEVLGATVHWSALSWKRAAEAGSAPTLSGEISVDPLAVAPVLARLQPDFGWGGDLTIGAHLVIGAADGTATGFSARASVARAQGDLTVTDELGTRTLGLSELVVELNAQHGVWTLHQRIVGQSVGILSATAVIHASEHDAWPNAAAPIEGSVALDVADLGRWGDWVPPGWRIAGTLQAYASLGGSFGAPEYTGGVVGKQLSLRNYLLGVDATEGELTARLVGRSGHIDRITAKAGKGTATIQGDVDLGNEPSATLQLQATQFQLLGRVDRRIVISGDARLKIDLRTVALNGRFKVDEGLIDFTRSDAPGLSDDVRVVRGTSRAAATDPPGETSATATSAAASQRSAALELNLDLGDHLRLRGRGLDTRLTGELKVTSADGRLAVNGTVHTVEGTYAAYNQKLSVDRGAITFSGALDNPRLDIEATRPNIDTRVGVQITGSAANPRVRLFSEPELSDIDKLSWLVLGRANDGLGSTDTALLQHAALALLAGEGGGLTDQLTKAIGLDDVSVRQQTDGTVQETVVSLGKQISQRWYVGYEHGLNATTGGFQLVYRIAQRFTLRMQSGTDNSVDLIWSWRWH